MLVLRVCGIDSRMVLNQMACRTLWVALVVLGVSGCSKEEASSESPTATSPNSSPSSASPSSALTQNTLTPNTPEAKADGETMSCAGSKKGENDDPAGGCNQWDAEAARVLEKKVPADATWTIYRVSGMKCGGCERRVIAKLGTLEGVVGVEADAEMGQVRVATSPKSPDAAKRAREALNGLYKIESTM